VLLRTIQSVRLSASLDAIDRREASRSSTLVVRFVYGRTGLAAGCGVAG
jgi:hypothetical protein